MTEELSIAAELEAPEANPELAEVAIFIETEGDKINFFATTRDDVPNEVSPAIIFAAFLRSNLGGLFNAAMAGWAASRQQKIVAEPPTRTILSADGNVARPDAALVLPAGYPPVSQGLDLESDKPLACDSRPDADAPCESCQ